MQNEAAAAGAIIAGLFLMVIYLAILVLVIAGLWKTFNKAGQPGWAAIIPIYNIYILMKVAGRPGWWVLLFFVPVVNFVISIIVALDVAKSFGRSTAFALGLIFLSPIFYCILGFGSSVYQGPAAGGGGSPPPLPA